ncbi:MAG: DNA polymerase [Bdellovibrionales bacterium]|nr:DNA polymerase [Bdellovibrionales bacterium]
MEHPFRWLLLDLNSYFATVEQQLNPKLRGRSVAVVPLLADTTSVIASSIEAKKLGIKTGTRVGEARRLCPEIVFCSGSHDRYVETHEKIVEAVERVLPVSAVLSIDEMACRLMGREQSDEHATRLAREIKASIRKHAGDYLSCSIGLAPNRYLAKVASDMQKPDGLVKIRREDLPRVLHGLSLRDFPGIGPRMEERLHRYGVHTVERLGSLSETDLRTIWGGVNGARFHRAIRGEDYEDPPSERKSLGHSHVLPPELRSAEKAFLVAQKLLHKAAARLRRHELWCGEVALSVSFLGTEERFSECLRVVECCDDITLLEALRELWSQVRFRHRPLKVGVTFGRLVSHDCHTLSLFENPRYRNLSLAVDAIQEKFGRDAVGFASMRALKGTAPTRIAFTNIPDAAGED